MGPQRITSLLVTATMALAIGACTKGSDDLPPTETKAEAAQRVETLIKEAFAQLPGGATLEFNDGTDEMPCEDKDGTSPKGRVFVDKRYRVVQPTGGDWPADQVIPALVAFWEKVGYRVRDDRRNDRPPRYVVLAPDDYSVIVDAWDRDGHYDYTLSSTSPCIWEDGTPGPR